MQKNRHVYKCFKPELWHDNIGKKAKTKNEAATTKQRQQIEFLT